LRTAYASYSISYTQRLMRRKQQPQKAASTQTHRPQARLHAFTSSKHFGRRTVRAQQKAHGSMGCQKRLVPPRCHMAPVVALSLRNGWHVGNVGSPGISYTIHTEESSVCTWGGPYGPQNGGLPISMWGVMYRSDEPETHIARKLFQLAFCSIS
jgi:hypothetical protein